MKPTEIGDKIKEMRTGRGWTLAQLGRKTRLSKSFLCEFERGGRAARLVTLEKIVRAFGLYLNIGFSSGLKSVDNFSQRVKI